MIEVMRSTILFSGMDDKELDASLSLLDARTVGYKRGDFLHRAYEPMDSFGIVLEGTVMVCMDDIEGNRMIMANVTKGATFGESLCFLKIKDSPVYITAATDCSILWLSAEKLSDGQAPAGLMRRFTAMLAARTLSMNSRIQVLSKVTLRDKLMTYFTQMCQAGGTREFNLTMNREDMALYMGTNRTALSRELSKMKAEGLIDFHKNSFKILI